MNARVEGEESGPSAIALRRASQTLEGTGTHLRANDNSPGLLRVLLLVLEFSFQALHLNLQLDVLKSTQPSPSLAVTDPLSWLPLESRLGPQAVISSQPLTSMWVQVAEDPRRQRANGAASASPELLGHPAERPLVGPGVNAAQACSLSWSGGGRSV